LGLNDLCRLAAPALGGTSDPCQRGLKALQFGPGPARRDCLHVLLAPDDDGPPFGGGLGHAALALQPERRAVPRANVELAERDGALPGFQGVKLAEVPPR